MLMDDDNTIGTEARPSAAMMKRGLTSRVHTLDLVLESLEIRRNLVQQSTPNSKSIQLVLD